MDIITFLFCCFAAQCAGELRLHRKFQIKDAYTDICNSTKDLSVKEREKFVRDNSKSLGISYRKFAKMFFRKIKKEAKECAADNCYDQSVEAMKLAIETKRTISFLPHPLLKMRLNYYEKKANRSEPVDK